MCMHVYCVFVGEKKEEGEVGEGEKEDERKKIGGVVSTAAKGM